MLALLFVLFRFALLRDLPILKVVKTRKPLMWKYLPSQSNGTLKGSVMKDKQNHKRLRRRPTANLCRTGAHPRCQARCGGVRRVKLDARITEDYLDYSGQAETHLFLIREDVQILSLFRICIPPS